MESVPTCDLPCTRLPPLLPPPQCAGSVHAQQIPDLANEVTNILLISTPGAKG